MDWEHIEEQLAQLLPEIRTAPETYWRIEGRPGEDSGAYIFVESMFATYVELLLHLGAAPPRDRLLGRAFRVLDQMLTSLDRSVRDLGYIGILEGREAWWLRQSAPFLGEAACAELDRQRPEWRNEIVQANLAPASQIVDLYGVRAVVAAELGCSVDTLPGQTHVV